LRDTSNIRKAIFIKDETNGLVLLSTNKFIGKLTRFKNLPSPLPQRVSAKGRNDFAKEGLDTSLWQREDWRDFPVNVFILLNSLVIDLISIFVIAALHNSLYDSEHPDIRT